MASKLTNPEFIPLSENEQNKINNLLGTCEHEASHILGYPCAHEFDYSPLFKFLSFPINNVGDPFETSNFHLNSHEFEREVIGYFAELYDAPKGESWGYVTNGGTEGNMYGTYLARELLPNGMVYFSEDTHYSVAKILRMVNARNIMIKSQDNGEIDYHDLEETIRIHRDVPPIIFANLGTTMKGATDNIDKIQAIMKRNAISQYYVHADAALSGMILPFVENPQPFKFTDGIDSVSISGHKMVGSPIPCGIVLAKKSHVNRIARSVEYIGSYDTTVSGSRNGISPLFLWYAIKTHGKKGFRLKVQRCLEMADYAIQKFQAAGIKAWRNKNSITVVFPRTNEKVLKRWQIAVNGNDAHIITMPQVKKRQIDAMIAEIRKDNIKDKTA